MKSNILLEGLGFPEGPRWHQGRLWFSDMEDLHVVAVDMDGKAEVMVETDFSPSGLGWLPNGDLLIVSMQDRRLLRFDGKKTYEAADLSTMATTPCNDMVVDHKGYAYIGNFGFNFGAGETPVGTFLIGVSPEGHVKELAGGLYFPNGMVITDKGRTLVVAETFGSCLTAFDIHKDNSLTHKRIWADLTGYRPDGIALDPQGGIWVTSAIHDHVIRVEEHGKITDRVQVSQKAFACAMGGENNNTLFVCTSKLGGSGGYPGAPKPGKIEYFHLT